MTNDTLTAVPGIRVGHWTDEDAATGCTVILCPPNTVGGVDVRGGAPGTRETDLLRPMYRIQQVNAVVLSGGSAFGLGAADGVMRYLAEHGEGYHTGSGHVVPIVPSAIVFDLGVGKGDCWPAAAEGYAACEAAHAGLVEQGTIGVGTGCSVGAALGPALATKGGVGSAAMALENRLVVAALVAVNAVGDVIESDGRILAGVRIPPNGTVGFAGMLNLLRQMPPSTPDPVENTVIGVVATNARLTKEEVNFVARMAHDGIARAVSPSHTAYDGDTLFALATGSVSADVSVVGACAAEFVALAIRRAVLEARSLAGVRSAADWSVS